MVTPASATGVAADPVASGERADGRRRGDELTRLWDVYLDTTDAAAVLRAAAVLERHDAIREPLPLDDAELLLARLRTVARIAEEEATSWGYEVEDRREEAEADGGRWGSPEIARTMVASAVDRATRSREVADTASAAAVDLAGRLTPTDPTALRIAERSTEEQARRLLDTAEDDQRGAG